MKAVIIDDERHALEEISILLEQSGAEVIGAFTSPEQGYEYILKEKPDCSVSSKTDNLKTDLKLTSILNRSQFF